MTNPCWGREKIYVDSTAIRGQDDLFTEKRYLATDIEYIRSDLAARWVSVKERLPKEDGQYAVLNDGDIEGTVFLDGRWIWEDLKGRSGVTHWLDGVPPVPEGEK